MANLELIKDKIDSSKNLSLEELKFLYDYKSLDWDIKKEIIEKRNIKEDLSIIFNCDINQVCLENEPAYCTDCRVFYGNINFVTMRFAYDLKFPKLVMGNLNLKRLKKANNVIFPEEIMGNLYLPSLVGMENCTLPKIIRGNLHINSFEDLDRLVLPDVVLGKIFTFYGYCDKKELLDKYIEKYREEHPVDGKRR